MLAATGFRGIRGGTRQLCHAARPQWNAPTVWGLSRRVPVGYDSMRRQNVDGLRPVPDREVLCPLIPKLSPSHHRLQA